jgi:hypothetical protein
MAATSATTTIAVPNTPSLQFNNLSLSDKYLVRACPYRLASSASLVSPTSPTCLYTDAAPLTIHYPLRTLPAPDAVAAATDTRHTPHALSLTVTPPPPPPGLLSQERGDARPGACGARWRGGG